MKAPVTFEEARARHPRPTPHMRYENRYALSNRRRGGLWGSDVVGACSVCNGPIFRDSQNFVGPFALDETAPLSHRRCPTKPEAA